MGFGAKLVLSHSGDRNAEHPFSVGARIRGEKSASHHERLAQLSPRILYQHREWLGTAGMCSNSWKQPPFFGMLALTELSHPAQPRGSGTDTAGRCFEGLKLHFSPSWSTFLMLLLKLLKHLPLCVLSRISRGCPGPFPCPEGPREPGSACSGPCRGFIAFSPLSP